MRRALGRGLDALIPAVPAAAAPKTGDGAPRKVALSKIRPNRLQPRRHFDPESLSELAASIKEHGLAQPLLVSPDANGETFELIAGERRLRACELAGVKEVEVFIRVPESDKKRLALALIENLQRENLNAIESALGYLRLMKEFGVAQSDLVHSIGKSQSAISNTMRLLQLSDEMQKALQFGQISEGHGRALLMIENPLERKRLFDIVLERKLSVRVTEDLARNTADGQPLEPKKISRLRPDKSADVKALESALEQLLSTKVEIKTKKDPTKGSITIHFFTLSDFDRIVNVFKK